MDIKEAIEIFELDDTISIKLIKEKYRNFQKKLHPDVSKSNNSEKLNKINEAYKTLINFLENFAIPVDYIKNYKTDEEKILNRFSEDWLSGRDLK